jgi:2-methylisocitrate lyase-like PEP mutase family enzyme
MKDATTPGARLRALLMGDNAVIAPGASDAWTARLIEEAGFPMVYATGAGIANTLLGMPDVGLTTLTEMATQIGLIADRIDVPVLADADTGFGGAANVQRTVRAYERAGVGGLHIEDQVMPKRCGHFDDKSVVSVDDMLVRLDAALDARRDSTFVIVARTDARAVEGLESAVERARLYANAGADALFVEALTSEEEFRIVGEELRGIPLIANMVEGGKSPLLGADELASLGYRVVLHANLALRLGAFAIREGLAVLREERRSEPLLDRILPWKDRQAIVGLDEVQAMERRILERRARQPKEGL